MKVRLIFGTSRVSDHIYWGIACQRSLGSHIAFEPATRRYSSLPRSLQRPIGVCVVVSRLLPFEREGEAHKRVYPGAGGRARPFVDFVNGKNEWQGTSGAGRYDASTPGCAKRSPHRPASPRREWCRRRGLHQRRSDGVAGCGRSMAMRIALPTWSLVTAIWSMRITQVARHSRMRQSWHMRTL